MLATGGKMIGKNRAEGALKRALRLKQEAEDTLEFAKLGAGRWPNLQTQSLLRQAQKSLVRREQWLRAIKADER